MNFSIVIIAKNEAGTLPKLFASLKEFQQKGGEVCLLDTGSTDNTIQVAEALGAKVFTGKFNRQINANTASQINKKFLVKESPIVKNGDTLFNFSEARNYITSKATHDMVCTMDADEAYTRLDVDRINQAIEEGYEQFEYQFVYAHDQWGNPAVQFIQSKFFNRTKAKWTGIVHEVITGPTKIKYLDESIIKLEHYQEPGKEHRANYLPGLAVDCFENPQADRQSHYFARELMYSGRFKSAIKEFKRHIDMKRWPAERAQSMIHIAHCYAHLGDGDQQLDWLHRAFDFDSTKRSALVQLGFFMKSKNNYAACAAYAAAALEIPRTDFYANNEADYRDLPHSLLYWAKGWMGDIEGARKHILKALEYAPYCQDYQRDTRFYFDYPDNLLSGWMSFDELQFLYEEAKKHKTIVEVGSWKGRSTHALLSGQLKGKGGTVFVVDTWEGSQDQRDQTKYLAKEADIHKIFLENVSQFSNLQTIRKPSLEAAKDFEDGSIDFCFLDAEHTDEALSADLEAWLPKMKPDGVIAGHDYLPNTWMGVCAAVDRKFGTPERHGYSIWSIDLRKQSKQPEQIPRNIFTAWLSNDPMPDEIKRCLDTQKIPGYSHDTITLETAHLYSHSQYLKDAIAAKKWVKAVDYLRMVCLNKGGIFLDADVEILPDRDFGCLLNEKLFVGKEVNNPDGSIVLGTAVIGAQPGHPLIKRWIAEVEQNFKGDDDKFYESSMDLLNKLGVDYQDQMFILEPDIFYPFNHFTGETNKTNQTIAIHHFNKSWIPENTGYTVTLSPEQLAKMIISYTNFTFVKRGDGELACMNGEQGQNCDGHKYSKKLGQDLASAFTQLQNQKALIVEFEDQKNYNILLHRTDNNPSVFWKAIRDSMKAKVFIGPKKLAPAAELLKTNKFIIVPDVDAFDFYDYILKSIPQVENTIYIFCAGMPAKCLIADLKKTNPDATYIDAGSAWDPLISQTRTYQMTREQVLALYRDNFKLEQETHPERLWVVNKIDEADKVIDLGCGTNKSLDRAVGVDIRPVTDVTASMDAIPSENNFWDVIISRHSLEHVLDPVKTIKEWMRVLRTNSKMLIVLPDHGSINTIDPYYSAGQHLHAYSMESFKSFISAFKDLFISKIEVVMQNWSFGTVIHYRLPTVSIIIPSLGRPEGLQRCKDSIAKLNYPQSKIEILEIEGEETVPEKVKTGFNQSGGEIICYAANDCEFTPDSLLLAVEKTKSYGLVAFNTGEVAPDEGNICEHFIIKRDLVETKLNGVIFDTRLHHCGVDNLLWAQASGMGQAHWCKEAVVYHYHFSKGGKMDEIYEKGWKNVDQDRKTLKEIMKNI